MDGGSGPLLFAICNNGEVVGFAEAGIYETEEGEHLRTCFQ